MRKIRSTEHQIISVLNSIKVGHTIKQICRELAISESNHYDRKAKYGRVETADI
ncbi:transposase [Klebsiella michiganensis]|nr:transposase [Klebsiella michiganensis]SBM41075.1 transposase [Klebsiella michiganensis]